MPIQQELLEDNNARLNPKMQNIQIVMAVFIDFYVYVANYLELSTTYYLFKKANQHHHFHYHCL